MRRQSFWVVDWVYMPMSKLKEKTEITIESDFIKVYNIRIETFQK